MLFNVIYSAWYGIRCSESLCAFFPTGPHKALFGYCYTSFVKSTHSGVKSVPKRQHTNTATMTWCTSGRVYVPRIYSHARWESLEDVPPVVFLYLVFIHMPDESYLRMYLQWSFCTLYLFTCQMRVTCPCKPAFVRWPQVRNPYIYIDTHNVSSYSMNVY